MRIDDTLSAPVRARFAAPRHAGRPAEAGDASGRAGSIRGGGLIELWLRVEDGRVVAARFEAFGCPATIACAEELCRTVEGRTVDDARGVDGLELAAALELAPAKRGVALLAEDALQAALAAAIE